MSQYFPRSDKWKKVRAKRKDLRAWKSGQLMLGPNCKEKIDQQIEKHIKKIKAGNEESAKARAEFAEAEPHIREQCRNRLEKYQQVTAGIRDRLGKGPQDWSRESIDRVDAIIQGRGKVKITDLQKESGKQRAKRDQQAWLDSFKPKPEYQGENHPLYLAAAPETKIKQSERASSALKQFEATGKIELIEPLAKADHRKWLEKNKGRSDWWLIQEIDQSDGYKKPEGLPVQEAEPLNVIFADIAKRKRELT